MLRRSLAQLLSNVKGAEFNPMIPEHSPGVRRPLLVAILHPQLSTRALRPARALRRSAQMTLRSPAWSSPCSGEPAPGGSHVTIVTDAADRQAYIYCGIMKGRPESWAWDGRNGLLGIPLRNRAVDVRQCPSVRLIHHRARATVYGLMAEKLQSGREGEGVTRPGRSGEPPLSGPT